jgi:hypothetical protein
MIMPNKDEKWLFIYVFKAPTEDTSDCSSVIAPEFIERTVI